MMEQFNIVRLITAMSTELKTFGTLTSARKLFSPIFLLIVSQLLSSCAQQSDSASAKIMLLITSPHKTMSRAIDNKSIPEELTDLNVKLYLDDTVIATSNLLSQSGQNTFYVPANKALRIQSDGFNGAEHLFSGNKSIAPLQAGEARAVTLALNGLVQVDVSEAQTIEPLPSNKTTNFQFTVQTTGLNNPAVEWYVNGIKGGDETVGTIDNEGNYTPSTLTSNQSVVIRAVPVAAPSFAKEIEVDLSPAQTPGNIAYLLANAGISQVTLSWNAVDNASEYRIYRSPEPDVTTVGNPLAVVTETQYTDSDVVANTTYYYKIVPANIDGAGVASNEATNTAGVLIDYELFTDVAFRQCVEEMSPQFWVEQLSPRFVHEVTALNCPGFNIASLSGIEQLTYLAEFDLFGERYINDNIVIDITPLSGLKKLTRLNLGSIGISDITALRNLTTLTYLDLMSNRISDLSPLSGLKALTYLFIDENTVSDLTPLSSLTELTDLSFWSNNIIDITPLSNLTKLNYLDLRNNNISNIESLGNLMALVNLDLSNNSISNITPLRNLTNLTNLYLDSNVISDLTPMVGLTALTELFLGSNNITDLTPLAGLTALTRLYLYSNNIGNISALAGLTSLQDLYLGVNNISNLTPLKQLSGLTYLNLSTNNISDVTPLSNLTSLQNLTLGYNNIKDVTPLGSLTGLFQLEIYGNPEISCSSLQSLDAKLDNSDGSTTGTVNWYSCQ